MPGVLHYLSMRMHCAVSICQALHAHPGKESIGASLKPCFFQLQLPFSHRLFSVISSLSPGSPSLSDGFFLAAIDGANPLESKFAI